MNSREGRQHDRVRRHLEGAVAAFAEGGYYGTTTADVARAIGVSQPRAMQIFGTKLTMFLRAHRYAGDQIVASVLRVAAPPFRPQVLGRAYVELVRSRPELLMVVFHAFSATKEPRIAEETRRLFFQMKDTVQTHAGASPEQARDFLARGMLINASLAMRLAASPRQAERDYLPFILGAAADHSEDPPA